MKERKKRLKRGSLFRRYFSYTLLMLMSCIVVLGAVMIFSTAFEWWDEKIQMLTDNTRSIVSTVDENYDAKAGIESLCRDKIITSSLDVMSHATNSDYFITNTDGNILCCKELGEIKDVSLCQEHSSLHITQDYMTKALDRGFSDYATDDLFGLGKFVVAVPITVENETVGAVFAVEDAISGLLPYILSIIQTLIYAILGGSLICFIAIFFLSRSITKPIAEMQEVANHFAKGEFEHRADETYKDAYHRRFARSLNKMADELSNNEEARKSFVANVSHELKTPMTTIGGFIDGILDGTIAPEKEREYLTIVSNEVKRLSRIVVSMLNLSKIEAGEVSLSPVTYDISAQIFETLLLFEKRINEKHIEIEGFEEMGSVSVSADRDLLQQVIYNLIDNAVKFTPENGKISLLASRKDDTTFVTIRNTGAGVSGDEISRLFERFYKVDKSRSYDVKGVGLGLYIVKTIINMHDGDIRASSKENEYTEFSFEIPD